MTLNEFKIKYLGKTIDYDNMYGHQCVDLIKAYTNEVLDIRLGTFGGSAKSGWENTSDTFPSNIWEKVVNNLTNASQIPTEGDIVFWNTGEYGHVAIVLDAYGNNIDVLEQNVGNGNGIGKDDNIRINGRGYYKILGWYTLKKDSELEILAKDNERLRGLLDTINKISGNA